METRVLTPRRHDPIENYDDARSTLRNSFGFRLLDQLDKLRSNFWHASLRLLNGILIWSVAFFGGFWNLGIQAEAHATPIRLFLFFRLSNFELFGKFIASLGTHLLGTHLYS